MQPRARNNVTPRKRTTDHALIRPSCSIYSEAEGRVSHYSYHNNTSKYYAIARTYYVSCYYVYIRIWGRIGILQFDRDGLLRATSRPMATSKMLRARFRLVIRCPNNKSVLVHVRRNAVRDTPYVCVCPCTLRREQASCCRRLRVCGSCSL